MIKIERKETPHTQEAMDDLQESCSTGHSYNTEHVNQALREVFHGKCYICENKEATSYQIEHLIPHRGDKKLIGIICFGCVHIATILSQTNTNQY